MGSKYVLKTYLGIKVYIPRHEDVSRYKDGTSLEKRKMSLRITILASYLKPVYVVMN